MAQELRFRSAVGWSFKVPALGIGVGLLASQWNGLNPAALVALGFSLALIVWLYVSTVYTVTDTSLRVQSGPIYSTIDAKLIVQVRPTRAILSAPALSLDRIEISGDFGAIVISPADKVAFLQALRRIAPQVRVDGTFSDER